MFMGIWGEFSRETLAFVILSAMGKLLDYTQQTGFLSGEALSTLGGNGLRK